MNTAKECIRRIESGAYDAAFTRLYGADDVERQCGRYRDMVSAFARQFGEDREVTLFSAPGRTEIGGNHTDHNHGRVLAGSVNLDVIAAVARSKENRVRVQSEGYPLDVVTLEDVSVKSEEAGCSSALIRGMADRLKQKGYAIGGFDAYTTSTVLKGSGISSSAAFEVLIGTIFSQEYNDGRIRPVEIAQMGQYAENVHFGKPCGLMDQMASAVGGIITIDFADPEAPIIHKVDFDFAKTGYRLCIVDTGGNHADLTPEYASIPLDMKEISKALGVSFLRETSMSALTSRMPELRVQFGDRAVLRAVHFLRDNERVARQVAALEAGDFDEFKRLVIESGNSSFEYLQNVFACSEPKEQGLSLALCLAQGLLEGRGAWRVHGGGFAGTTQNFVPEELLDTFRAEMEHVFGKGKCHVLNIRPIGGVCLDTLKA